MRSKSFTLLFVLLIAGYISTRFLMLRHYHENYVINYNESILRYQRHKLNTSETDYRTVILGDSSAGNAIDAALFSTLTGKKTINLALTGDFGIYSAVVMLQNALQHYPQLQTAVIVFSPAVWGHRFLDDAYFLMRREGLDDPVITLESYIAWYLNTNRFQWVNEFNHDPVKQAFTRIDPRNDYLTQYQPTVGLVFPDYTTPLPNILNGIHFTWLNQLAALCHRTRPITCIFMNGPIFEAKLKASGSIHRDTLQQVQQHLPPIRYVNEFQTFDQAALGDTLNHVRQEFKATYTRFYAERYQRVMAPP